MYIWVKLKSLYMKIRNDPIKCDIIWKQYMHYPVFLEINESVCRCKEFNLGVGKCLVIDIM